MPAALTYMPYRMAKEEPPLAFQTSTGLAAGATPEDAIVSAICEVMERDAFVIAWQNHVAVPTVPIYADECHWLREVLASRFLWPSIQYWIGDLTPVGGIPTYAVVSRGPSPSLQRETISFGAAAHPVGREALIHALLEAAMGRVYVKSLITRHTVSYLEKDHSRVRTFSDHAQFYTRFPRLSKHLMALFDADHAADLSRLEGSLVASGCDLLYGLLHVLDAAGLHAVFKDLTTPDIGQVGMHVVRVLVPGMQLLHGDHRFPFLGGQRIRRPGDFFPDCTRRSREFPNRFSHPYP